MKHFLELALLLVTVLVGVELLVMVALRTAEPWLDRRRATREKRRELDGFYHPATCTCYACFLRRHGPR